MVRALGPLPTYAAIVLLATVFFFFLHHVGNRIPYELAVQKFRAEAEAGRPDEGQARGYKTDYEYCQISEAVAAGAKWARGEFAAREAVILKTFEGGYGAWENCRGLDAAFEGVEVEKMTLKTRYWWGSKALYAIALRHLSVHRIRELTRVSTRIAWLLLAVSLVLAAPRTLPATGPLLVSGAFFSGLEYWADVANGMPYLWMVLSAAVLVWLMRGGTWPGVVSGRTPVWCFAAGTVSSYLWLGDGHTFLAITWIGLLVWFGHDGLGAAERTRRAVWCIALYVAGFLACYGLGQVAKGAVEGYGPVWSSFREAVLHAFRLSAADAAAGLTAHLGAYLHSFYAMAWPIWLPAGAVLPSLAASALAAAVAVAVFRARRGRCDLLWSVLWIVGLMSVNAVNFVLIPDDIPYRAARFVFAPLALCCSCLVLSVQATDWKFFSRPGAKLPRRPSRILSDARRLSSAGAPAGLGGAEGTAAGRPVALGVVLVAAVPASWYFATLDARTIDELLAGVGDTRPIVSSHFDVYLDGNRLVYAKDDCGAEDADATVFVHLYPADPADLPDARRPHGFDNRDFAFERYGLRGGGRCAAVRALPGYGIARIRTGQYVPGQDPEWSAGARLSEPRSAVSDSGAIDELLAGVEDTPPVVSAAFDVYLDGNRLVYVREECGPGDVEAGFFLHLYPVDAADLPDARRPHGFDNFDFTFETYGLRGGGRCAAVRILPEYGIASIHTGQFTPGQARDWDERISLEATAHAP